MSYTSPLLNHYSAMLRSLGVHIDENAMAYATNAGSNKQTPITVENRRLILPTELALRTPNWDEQIAFHPFSESLIRGQSQIIHWLTERISLKLNMLTTVIVGKLIELCADGSAQEGLTSDQLKVISDLGDANDKTCENFEKLTKSIIKGDTSWIHIYLRHSGKRGTDTYARYARVTFPIYEDLVNDNETIGGVRGLRAKDKKLLINIMRYLFENIEEKDEYSYGSNSKSAPYYHALINSYAQVARAINRVMYKFRKELGDVAQARMGVDEFIDTFDEAAAMANTIGAMKFNIGEGGQGTGEGDVKVVNIKDEPTTTDAVNAIINNTVADSSPSAIANRFGIAQPQGGALNGLFAQQPSILSGIPRKGGLGLGNGLNNNLGGGLLNQGLNQRNQLGGFPQSQGLIGLNQPAFGGGLASYASQVNPLSALPRK